MSESKLKVLATIYRKLLKLNDDSIPSEVLYSIQNRIEPRSQCLAIISDHKHSDLFPITWRYTAVHPEIAYRLQLIRIECNLLRDKLNLMIE